MSDLMELLYEYAQKRRAAFLDLQVYERSEELEKKALAALKDGLSGESLASLERYQDACREQRAMDAEAMFLAGFSTARELAGL